jgi:hypothetical protein
MMSGEARALRNRPCICTPATASPAPTSAATMTRGVRINQTMTCCGSGMSLTSTNHGHPCGKTWEANTRATIAAGTGALPMAIPTTKATSNTIVTTTKYPPTRCVKRPREARSIRTRGASIILLSVAIESVRQIPDEAHDMLRDR